MAFGNRLTSVTQDKILPAVVDTILNSNVLAQRMLRKAKRWSGEQMKFPVKLSKNTTGTSWSGFDTFSTSATDNRNKLVYDPKFQQITVALPLDELSANQTDAKVLDLAAVEMTTAAFDMSDDIGTEFYADGTGNSSKDFLGLEALVDDGTNVATIGGLSRSTNTTLKGTTTASGGTLTLAKMSTLYNAAASGSIKPTAAYCDETIFNLYEQLLQPQERIDKGSDFRNGEFVGGTGFTALMFRGIPVLADEKATAQTLYMVNENFMHWYALPVAETEAVKFRPQDIKGTPQGVEGLGFSWSGWIKPANQAAIISHIYLGGQLLTDNPKRHAKLTGITGV